MSFLTAIKEAVTLNAPERKMKIDAATMGNIIHTLVEVGFNDDSSLRHALSTYSAYHLNGGTRDLEYTERFAGLRFIAKADQKGNLREIFIFNHGGQSAATPAQIDAANRALTQYLSAK